MWIYIVQTEDSRGILASAIIDIENDNHYHL